MLDWLRIQPIWGQARRCTYLLSPDTLPVLKAGISLPFQYNPKRRLIVSIASQTFRPPPGQRQAAMAVANFHYITRMSSGFKVYILEGELVYAASLFLFTHLSEPSGGPRYHFTKTLFSSCSSYIRSPALRVQPLLLFFTDGCCKYSVKRREKDALACNHQLKEKKIHKPTIIL